jgi:predicted RNase H-like HicB family nuclease
MKDIVIEITLPIAIRRKARACIAACPCLDVCSQGETEEEARANIEEALKAFLVACYERGTLDEAFKQCGYAAVTGDRKRRASPRNHVTITLRLSSPARGAARCRI